MKKQKSTKHNVNQLGNDWITCRCGKLFSATKSSPAKTKFIRHLKRYEESLFCSLVSDNITKKRKRRSPTKRWRI